MDPLKIVQNLMRSYQDQPMKKDHCACSLPSNREIKQILSLTKELIYPGYFGKSENDGSGDRKETARIVRKLMRKVRNQIAAALLYIANEAKKSLVLPRAEQLTEKFLLALPAIREALAKDLEAHFAGDPAAFNRDEIVVSYPGMYAIMIYRIAHQLFLMQVPLIPRMMTEFAHRETGIDIHPGATIGESFLIDHGTGVVIGETTTIGNHVKIYQGVTLGALSTKGGQNWRGKKRHPTIGDRVTIYAGASILGGDTVIGSDTTLGSNVFITESIKNGSKVAQKSPEIVIQTDIHTEKGDQNQ